MLLFARGFRYVCECALIREKLLMLCTIIAKITRNHLAGDS